MPELLSIGISHKTAPVALRERLALSTGQAKQLMHDLIASDEVHEAVAISTCNRTELYLVAPDSVAAESLALSKLAKRADIRPTELVELLYTFHGSDMVAQLMRVCGGLDSMIVGETEVLGQVKRAYELALGEGTTGPITNRLFGHAIAAGKRVQTETWIGALKVSVSSAAVELARETLGDLGNKKAIVIGAGGNGELTARALSDAGVDTVFVANRHYDRAIGVAEGIGGKAVRFEKLPDELTTADIVLSSTGSPHALIHADEMKTVMGLREGRPLLIIDIAVPRDVADEVGDVPGITLFDMDDLQADVDRNLSVRRSEAAKAEIIVAQEVEKFERWMVTLEVIPTIAELRKRAESIAEQVVTENASRFEDLSDADRARVEAMAGAIVSRILHEPTLKLKKSSGEEDAYVYIQALRDLFALDAGEAPNVETDDDLGSVAEIHSLDDQRSSRDRAQS
ncbi:MAG: glutamyl-tRNA reductase [Solirubrobacterales bacterium]|nr:glutamyl-tRNA reductase [Solirubrobacterales bacterium]